MLMHNKVMCTYNYDYVCYDYRYKLLKATSSAIALVKEGRQRYTYLNRNIWIMVELALLLIGKVFTVDDKEVTLLTETDWNLNKFAREIIIAFTHGIKFGGYLNDHKKEIQVREYIYIYIYIYIRI